MQTQTSIDLQSSTANIDVAADYSFALSTYEQLHDALSFTIHLALSKRLSTYGHLATKLGLPTSGNYMATVVSEVLTNVDTYCRSHGMQSTIPLIVNNNTSVPGNGFFKMMDSRGAYDCSVEHSLSQQAIDNLRKESWRKMIDEVYSFWAV